MYDSKVCNNHFAKVTKNCMGDDGASVVVLYSEEYGGEVLRGMLRYTSVIKLGQGLGSPKISLKVSWYVTVNIFL